MTDPLTVGLATTGALVTGIGLYGAKAMNTDVDKTFEEKLKYKIEQYEADKERQSKQRIERLENMIKELQEEKAKCEKKTPKAEEPSEVEKVASETASEAVLQARKLLNPTPASGTVPAATSGLAVTPTSGTVSAATGTSAAASGVAVTPTSGTVSAPTGLSSATQRTLTPLPGTPASSNGTAPAAASGLAALASGLAAATGLSSATQRTLTSLPDTSASSNGTVPAPAGTGFSLQNTDTPIENVRLGGPPEQQPAVSPEDVDVSPGLFQPGTLALRQPPDPDFIEGQEQGSLGCGRHALNNFLGGKYFVKDDGSNINSIDQLNAPVSLQTLCRYITPPGEVGYCPDNEDYDYNVLDAGLRLYGYELDPVNYPIMPLRPEASGFLLHKPDHWYLLRREEDGQYAMLDSLGETGAGGKVVPVRGTLAELEERYVRNIANISVFEIISTGVTTDLKPLLPEQQEQEIPATESSSKRSTTANIPLMSARGPSRVGQALQEANPIRKEAQFSQDTSVQTSPGKTAATLASQPSNNRLGFGPPTANVPASQSASPPTPSTGATRLTRKKKLRTRRATKQKNVRGTRSR